MLCECAKFFQNFLNILKAQCELGAPVAPQAPVHQIFSPYLQERERYPIQHFGSPDFIYVVCGINWVSLNMSDA